jgi:DNA-binding winged helix-turn-helix (wHTH) protein
MDRPPSHRPRYRFGEFTLCPSRRLLLRGGEAIPLIPRYFDLLVLLVDRREEAVHRREILDAVWSDVVVSDGALSQAVRVLRRALGDDPREPAYICTVSRHGYRFIADVAVQSEADPPAPGRGTSPPSPAASRREPAQPAAAALDVLLDASRPEAECRDAAEALHASGTAEALRMLDRRPGHERARAILRDSRWEVPGAGAVPLLGQPGMLRTAAILAAMRVGHAVRLARSRWLSGIAGGSLTGLLAGSLGGLVLRYGPGSVAGNSVLVALPLVGLLIGGLGAAGVGAGIAGAEAVARSSRSTAIVLLGAAGGGAVGAVAHGLGRIALASLFGHDLSPPAGGFEGLVIGGSAGLGYALATPRAEGGMATPRGRARLRAVVVSGAVCAAAAALLAFRGSHLGAMSLDLMARTFPGSSVGLDPLARLLGESGPGPLTRVVISGFEGGMFGTGLVLGLTRRPTGLREPAPLSAP